MKPDNSMTEDEEYMRAALELARQGWDAGEVPVGALLAVGLALAGGLLEHARGGRQR